MHDLTRVPAKAATCNESGHKEHWICNKGDEPCNKYFDDADGKNETTADDTIIPKHGHLPGSSVVTRTGSSCEEEGHEEETVYCERCEEVLNRTEKTIAAHGHRFTKWVVLETSVCGDSVIQERSCEICGKREIQGELGDHTWEESFTIDKEPTCIEEGSRSIHCGKCGATKNSEVISPKGHQKEDLPEIENEKTPACTEAGSYEEVFYCKVCKEELQRIHRITEATGHDWNEWITETEATTESEGLQTRICKRDPLHREEKPIPMIEKEPEQPGGEDEKEPEQPGGEDEKDPEQPGGEDENEKDPEQPDTKDQNGAKDSGSAQSGETPKGTQNTATNQNSASSGVSTPTARSSTAGSSRAAAARSASPVKTADESAMPLWLIALALSAATLMMLTRRGNLYN